MCNKYNKNRYNKNFPFMSFKVRNSMEYEEYVINDILMILYNNV